MAYLSLFTFFMLMLVTADNLVQLFFGWEGRGPRSYLLIGFWYDRPSANAAAIKAFIVNRVGDFGFALGIFAVFVMFELGAASTTVFAAAPDMAGTTHPLPRHATCRRWTTALPAAVRRRHGQVGAARPAHLAARRDGRPDPGLRPDPCRDHGDGRRLHGLPPVAAVRVCADARWRSSPSSAPRPPSSPPPSACTQYDIKRVIAYSTCSQLGYMFFAAGVGAYRRAPCST